MKSISITELIKLLENEIKNGAINVQIDGTILISELGNKIIISTEKQM